MGSRAEHLTSRSTAPPKDSSRRTCSLAGPRRRLRTSTQEGLLAHSLCCPSRAVLLRRCRRTEGHGATRHGEGATSRVTIGTRAATSDWARAPRRGLRGLTSPVTPATFASRAVRHIPVSCRAVPRESYASPMLRTFGTTSNTPRRLAFASIRRASRYPRRSMVLACSRDVNGKRPRSGDTTRT